MERSDIRDKLRNPKQVSPHFASLNAGYALLRSAEELYNAGALAGSEEKSVTAKSKSKGKE